VKHTTLLVSILFAYPVFLFLVAAVAERFGRRLRAPRLRAATWVLAISVYCTAWTFYGSVGLAANRGLEFLTIYLGPALAALMWPIVLRRLVRIAKEQRITTISDFIASRYGKSVGLGTLVAALVVCGMIPYIALQLKAVSVTFWMMIPEVADHPEWSRLLVLGEAPAASYTRWTVMLLVSMLAVMLLPRQFHVLVVQNPREADVGTAAWAFPLYLLAINVFVLPIALGGLLTFPGRAAEADSFILALPLHAGADVIAVAVFLGGFSAATAMIVVDSLALSKMISNDIVLPFVRRRRRLEEVYSVSLASMRVGILVVVSLGFVWARVEAGQFLLVEMGLLSFIAVAQCAPAVFLGLAWPRANRRGPSPASPPASGCGATR
jgi:Na+/proline symporter